MAVADGAPRAVAPRLIERRRLRQQREVGSRFEDIVDAAAEIFLERGYERTTIQDVAERVGLNKGSLYHYIHSKEDLLYAVLQEAHQHTAQQGAQALSVAGDALAKLTYVVHSHLSRATADAVKTQVFYQEAKFLAPNRLEEILASRDTYAHAVRQIIAEGQAEGVIAPHLDPQLTSIAILALLNSLSQWFRPEGPRTLDDVKEVFTHLVIHGVSGGPGARLPTSPRSSSGARTSRRKKP